MIRSRWRPTSLLLLSWAALIPLATTLHFAHGQEPGEPQPRHLDAPDPGATTLSAERLEAVADFVRRNRARLDLPGVAVSIATADSVVLALGDGQGAAEGSPVSEHTPFLIGSVTKTLTAALVVHSSRRGLLDLDAPVETYLEDFSLRAPFTARSITLRHLLGHRSGLSQWSGHDQRAQHSGRFDHIAPRGPPGERAEYSSLNFVILGRVLEEAHGQRYDRLLEELLFRPLHMRTAFVYTAAAEIPPSVAPGHQSYFGVHRRRGEPLPPPHLPPAGFAGASANDLARYGGMLVGRGVFAGERILDEETVDELLGPLDGSGSALGWGRRRIDGRLVIEHSGNSRTSAARIRLVPNAGYALTVLTNTNSGPFFDAADALMDGIDRILQGEPERDPLPMERLFKGVILVGTTLSVLGLARRTRDWRRAGYPVALISPSVGRLALDVGIGAAVLIGVPRLVGVPLSTMLEYFPDLGIGLAVSAGAGMVGGALRAFTSSARGAGA
jgi:CubicO group peptidase (beta-lactamase class C family)